MPGPIAETITALNRRQQLAWAKALPIGKFGGFAVHRWLGPRRWEYIPEPFDPFRFIRANGDVIEPKRMNTDLITIPLPLEALTKIERDMYVPASDCHDHLCDEHHAGRGMPFHETNLVMVEAMVTLMALGICRTNYPHVVAVWKGINSAKAKRMWNGVHHAM